MIYTSLTKKALKLSFEKHKDQIDKSGLPYIYHPLILAENMKDEYSTCVALLHDIVEDTDVTLEMLFELGFPKEVIEAIAVMTHDSNEDYFLYIERIKQNLIAKKVKVADLKHNSDLNRLEIVTDIDLARNAKYKKALKILEE